MTKATIAAAILLSWGTLSAQPNTQYRADGKKLTVYTTAQNSNFRLSKTGDFSFAKSEQPLETEVSVFVEPSIQFQSIVGIGGAITDASAETFAKLSAEKQKELLSAYYDAEKGIGYSIMRTHINSCDFSSGSYTYVKEGDKTLSSFSIAHDKKYRIPMIKQALKTANNPMKLFVSPWSPPAYMKDNNNMLRGGKLLPEYYQTWADYFVKFIQSYEKEGIPVWAMTIQNEPMATQTWESCIFTAEAERDFLKKYLGPTITKNFQDKKIIVWDHNRDMMKQRADVIFSDSEALKYVWGMGFHWYEPWSGGTEMFDNTKAVHEAYPNINLFFTEGCKESFKQEGYQLWSNGEHYGRNILNDFSNGTVGWTDWNILLDEKGGPNHVGNFCFAPIHADTKTGQLIYTPTYYYIGHFSKFVQPEAKRVSSAVSRSNLQSVSFQNKNGQLSTVVMNESEKEVKYNLIVGSQRVTLNIPAHAIQTLVY